MSPKGEIQKGYYYSLSACRSKERSFPSQLKPLMTDVNICCFVEPQKEHVSRLFPI